MSAASIYAFDALSFRVFSGSEARACSNPDARWRLETIEGGHRRTKKPVFRFSSSLAVLAPEEEKRRNNLSDFSRPQQPLFSFLVRSRSAALKNSLTRTHDNERRRVSTEGLIFRE